MFSTKYEFLKGNTVSNIYYFIPSTRTNQVKRITKISAFYFCICADLRVTFARAASHSSASFLYICKTATIEREKCQVFYTLYIWLNECIVHVPEVHFFYRVVRRWRVLLALAF